MIDEDKLAGVFSVIRDPEKRERLISAFEINGSLHVEKLKIAADRNDRDDFFKRAHSLKGGAGTIGLTGLVSICSDIEVDDEESVTAEQMAAWAESVEQAFGHSCELLRNQLESCSS